MDIKHQLVQQAVTGLLAIIRLGGTVALALIGRPIPEFLVGFDGVIVTAAFANGAFFVQARIAAASPAALGHLTEKYHELAIAGIKIANSGSTGTSERVNGSDN